jgi:hypothetical protein
LKQAKWSDISFTLQDSDGPVQIKCHRALLSTRCDKFKAMFSSGLLESRLASIDLPDISLDAFNAMLYYIYTDKSAISGSDPIAANVGVETLTDYTFIRQVKMLASFFHWLRSTSYNDSSIFARNT